MTRHRIVPFHRLEAIDIFDLLHRRSIDTVSLTTTLAYATMSSELCPVYAPFFGAMGCTSAIVFTCESVPQSFNIPPKTHTCVLRAPLGIGAAYGTAKSGVGISAMSVLRPDLMMKCVVPVIMAGIIAIVSV